MSEFNTDIDTNSDSERPRRSRYPGFAIGDSGYVIYDDENIEAWVMSDTSVPPAEVQ
jgi:hypothetical protein